LGARADTTETDWKVLDELNLEYSKTIFSFCYQLNIPLIYASSAATYGNGELGYSDNLLPEQLKPLNLYAESKNQFDDWVLGQVIDEETPPMWQGLKFFNVYGAGESHKGRMASMVWHAYEQIRTSGKVRLFRSHHPDFADGEQSRDFVHVSDVCAVIHHFCTQYQAPSGLFNLGTGKSRTFLSLVQAVFKNMNLPEQIEWVDTPADIRDKYQYFTEADIAKLRKAGYKNPFLTLEAGVETYIKQLASTKPQP
jgi:ADP-L-glycero-D-manno-heptose 6-epimerase